MRRGRKSPPRWEQPTLIARSKCSAYGWVAAPRRRDHLPNVAMRGSDPLARCKACLKPQGIDWSIGRRGNDSMSQSLDRSGLMGVASERIRSNGASSVHVVASVERTIV